MIGFKIYTYLYLRESAKKKYGNELLYKNYILRLLYKFQNKIVYDV